MNNNFLNSAKDATQPKATGITAELDYLKAILQDVQKEVATFGSRSESFRSTVALKEQSKAESLGTNISPIERKLQELQTFAQAILSELIGYNDAIRI